MKKIKKKTGKKGWTQRQGVNKKTVVQIKKIQTGDVVPGRVLHTSFPASNVTITTGSDRSHIFSRPPPIDGTTHFLGWIT
jgi:ribosomal protein S6E (S10)